MKGDPVGHPSAGAKRPTARRRFGISALIVVVVLVGGGLGLYLHLNANLHTAALTAGGHERTDPAGRTPINLLVVGSDTRASSVDCAIGGGCSPAAATSTKATSASANGDVLMLVHISADRSNASIMSIPRDTMMTVPSCTDAATGAVETAHPDRINSTLQYGVNCSVAAVHRLTGIAIDHFLVIDFAGVVSMSDAVGGVPVCVDNNVYDPYSQLKLTKGTHTLQGKAALEFLRTRHGFGDGSDIGRTVAQHIFLSAMLRSLESTSTLANPVTVLKLANAATSAVTVDTALGSVQALTSLAYQLNEVPGSRTTFVTAPTVQDPANPDAVVLASNAPALFAKIADDTSLSPSGAAPSHRKPTVSTSTSKPGAEQQTAAGTGKDYETTVTSTIGCAQVSTEQTVAVGGRLMTPTQAFADTPNVPVSAP